MHYDRLNAAWLYLFPGILGICTIIFPLFALYLLYKYKNEEFIRIRSAKWRVYCGIVFILYANGFIPFICIFNYMNRNNMTIKTGNSIDKFNQYIILTHSLTVYCTTVLLLIQRFRGFSKFKIANDTADWKKHLNPEYSTRFIDNWSIINNDTLAICLSLFLWICYSTPTIVVIAFLDVKFYTACTVYIICAIIFDVTFFAFNILFGIEALIPVNDTWYVGEELKLSKSFIIHVIILFIGHVLYLIKIDLFFDNNWHFIVYIILWMQLSSPSFWLISFVIPIWKNIQTPYHVRLIKRIEQRQNSSRSKSNMKSKKLTKLSF